MLAVSLDILTNINVSPEYKIPGADPSLFLMRTECPIGHLTDLVLNLPKRSTAFTCRYTKPLSLYILYKLYFTKSMIL